MRFTSASARALLVCVSLLLVSSVVPRADTAAQSLPFAQDWTNTSLITAGNDWSGVPGIIGYRGDGLVSGTGRDPQLIVADGSATPVNVLANQGNPNTLTTGGIAEFNIANPVVALQGSGTASAPHLVITVSTAGQSNITVSYNLRDVDGSGDNSIQPVALQYRVGTTGTFTNLPAGFVADASSGPSLATLVTPVSVTLPASANNQPIVQLRIITTDAVGSDEWIGIDDISVTAGAVSQSTNPTGTITASPSIVSAGDEVTFTVNVTPGTNPDSLGIAVTGNLAALGLGTPAFMDQGNNTFTFTGVIPAGVSSGAKAITATITDSNSPPRSSTTPPVTVTVQATLANSTVVISQLYGGGGNSGATFRNDYVMLYNRSAATVDLTGWSLQYASAAGTSWDNRQPLGGPIGPGQYYLIALASGGATGGPLPDANVAGDINMSATAGKVALVDSFESLSGTCPVGDPHVRDFVGYGATATCHEGAANAPAPSNTTALLRLADGFTDTNENGSDFVAGTPEPDRTAPIVELGPAVLGTDPLSNRGSIPRDATIEVNFTEPVDVVDPWFDITCTATGSHNSATFAGTPGDRFITPNVNFQAGESCTVTIFKDQVHDQDLVDSDPNTDTLPANYVWSFTVATGTAPPFPSSVHLAMGNPTAATADLTHPLNYLMEKPEYALSYNRDLGRPNWVSWHLSEEWVGTLTRVDSFRADPAVPPDWYRVQAFDFSGSGFDRGHMVPNADRDKETSIPINQATFLMSNMVAQAPDNNQGPWADLENDLRRLLVADPTHPADEIYIVAGPAGVGGSGSNGGVTSTVADGHVTVPAFTWKAALVIPAGSGDDLSRVDCTTQTIAVIMPNTQGIRNADWHNYLTTVDAIESLTGYDLFSNLPADIQPCVQGGINGDNPKPQAIAFAPIGAHQYGDADFAVNATATSGLDVSLSVVSGPAVIVNGLVHLTGAGPVTIRASQPGTPNPTAPLSQTFARAVPVEQTFTAAKAAPAFSALSAPVIEAGTASAVLGGVINVNGLVPPGSVEIAVGGVTVMAPIGASGQFSASIPTGTLGLAGSPYAIAFSYAGDSNFTSADATSTLTVVDTTAPAIAGVSVSPNVIAVPNHKMVAVAVGYSASDLSGLPVCAMSVSSSEPINGLGDGNTSTDWQVLDAHHVMLRAERSGLGSGRVYTLTVRCTDAAGNTSASTGTVAVPK